jgi:exodeoxyribonuclease-3
MYKTVFSYNVNGIRSALNKGFDYWLAQTQPDVICLQEIKASIQQINTSIFDRAGYRHYWFPAQKAGYSGVAILCKEKPDNVVFGMDIEKYDFEGRLLRADFGDVTVISLYLPSGTSGEVRQSFKMEFLVDLLQWLENLRKERPNLIISGDFNIAHKEIDINNPKRHQKTSGFLPEERAWIDKCLSIGYLDTFRMFNDKPNMYSWWSYRGQSRTKDLGWRIDYNLVSNALKDRIKDATIVQTAVHSDHCPVAVTVDF